jgi:hypothetical protein
MPPVEATAMGSPNPSLRVTARVEAVGPRGEHAHVRKVSHELCSASGDAPLLPLREARHGMSVQLSSVALSVIEQTTCRMPHKWAGWPQEPNPFGDVLSSVCQCYADVGPASRPRLRKRRCGGLVCYASDQRSGDGKPSGKPAPAATSSCIGYLVL